MESDLIVSKDDVAYLDIWRKYIFEPNGRTLAADARRKIFANRHADKESLDRVHRLSHSFQEKINAEVPSLALVSTEKIHDEKRDCFVAPRVSKKVLIYHDNNVDRKA